MNNREVTIASLSAALCAELLFYQKKYFQTAFPGLANQQYGYCEVYQECAAFACAFVALLETHYGSIEQFWASWESGEDWLMPDVFEYEVPSVIWKIVSERGGDVHDYYAVAVEALSRMQTNTITTVAKILMS